MRVRVRWLVAAILVGFSGVARSGAAEEPPPGGPAYELVFPDRYVRFHVTRDVVRGTLHFRTDGLEKVSAPPVLTLQSPGAQALTVETVAAPDGTWRVAHDLLKQERFEGTIAVQVGDRKLTAPLVLRVIRVPRHGGHLLEMCERFVEVVHDLTGGTVTIYTSDDAQMAELPVVSLSEPPGVAELKLEPVPGRRDAWKATSPLFKTTQVTGALRARIDGKFCEAEVPFVGIHGGRIARWPGGLRYELVPDPNSKSAYLVYFLDETWQGKPYSIERADVLWGRDPEPRVLKLEPLANQPRAYRILGPGAVRLRPETGRLRLVVAGRTLETELGWAGANLVVAR